MLDESLASSPTVRFGAYRSRESREKPCSWLGCSSLASPRCILVGYNVLETSRLRASTLRGGRHSVSSSLVKEAHRDKAGRAKPQHQSKGSRFLAFRNAHTTPGSLFDSSIASRISSGSNSHMALHNLHTEKCSSYSHGKLSRHRRHV